MVVALTIDPRDPALSEFIWINLPASIGNVPLSPPIPRLMWLGRCDIEERLDLTVECIALDMDRTDISYGVDDRTPQLRQTPALYPVPWATNSASN